MTIRPRARIDCDGQHCLNWEIDDSAQSVAAFAIATGWAVGETDTDPDFCPECAAERTDDE